MCTDRANYAKNNADKIKMWRDAIDIVFLEAHTEGDIRRIRDKLIKEYEGEPGKVAYVSGCYNRRSEHFSANCLYRVGSIEEAVKVHKRNRQRDVPQPL